MLYMLVEHFRDPVPVYRCFQPLGRRTPEGLVYVSSWVDEGLSRCFQLMETEDRGLLEAWTDHWRGLVEFEVFPVLSSAAAAERVAPRL